MSLLFLKDKMLGFSFSSKSDSLKRHGELFLPLSVSSRHFLSLQDSPSMGVNEAAKASIHLSKTCSRFCSSSTLVSEKNPFIQSKYTVLREVTKVSVAVHATSSTTMVKTVDRPTRRL